MQRLTSQTDLTRQCRRWGMACLLALSLPLAADPPDIGPDKAADIATSRSGGRVLDVKPVEKSGRPAYRVKVLKDGRVRTQTIDAEGDQGRRR